nr:unnamed protein product [Callosobruchus chinensis]
MSEVTGISRTSIQRILKHYKWHPYKIQLLHELNEDDHDRRLQFICLTIPPSTQFFVDFSINLGTVYRSRMDHIGPKARYVPAFISQKRKLTKLRNRKDSLQTCYNT